MRTVLSGDLGICENVARAHQSGNQRPLNSASHPNQILFPHGPLLGGSVGRFMTEVMLRAAGRRHALGPMPLLIGAEGQIWDD